MIRKIKVKSHKRKLKSGKIIPVKSHLRNITTENKKMVNFYASNIIRDKKMEESALEYVNFLTMSGGDKNMNNLTGRQIEFLQKTVENKSYKLYRGIGLIRQRFTKEQRDKINELSEGDDLSDFLYKSFMYDNNYSSFSKKKSVANYYSQGVVSIIVEGIVNPNNILVDLEHLDKIAPDSKYVIDNNEYFKTDKEVIVIEPVKNLKIIKKKGVF